MKTTRLLLASAVCAAMLFAGCSEKGGEDQPETYTITVSSGDNGEAEADKESAAEGATVKLTATPDDGYEFVKWTVESGGITLPATATATFTMPARNVSVKAEFAVTEYAVTVTSGSNGTAEADKTSAAEGQTINLTAEPAEGYVFKQWVAEGITFSPDATTAEASFTMPAENVSISAEFEVAEYTVTVTSDGSGTAEADKTLAAEGQTVNLTAKPDEGYVFKQWVAEGITFTPDATTAEASFTMPAENVSVSAEFIAVYTVAVASDGNGTAETDKKSAAEGAIVTLTATPDPGYEFVKWTVDSGDVELSGTTDNPATFTMPAGDVEISAEFVATEYTVTVTSGSNVAAETDNEIATIGQTITLTATPEPGYGFDKWTVVSGGVTLSNTAANPATFTMPAGDVEIKAEFIVIGILISGVLWAPCNVDAPGTFAANPEDAGMFYQWNRKIGWSSEDPLTSSPAGATWVETDAEGEKWEADNDPCPTGWRVPTHEEQAALCDVAKTTNEWMTLNGVDGRRFTDNDSGNSVFFPLAGLRFPSQAELDYVGNFGYYWSATQSNSGPTYSFHLYLYSNGTVGHSLNAARALGYSVRCRAE